MNIEMSLYIEINIFGIVILSAMLFCMKRIRSSSAREGQGFFTALLLSNIVILLADMCIYIMRYQVSELLIILNHITCMTYFTLHPVFGYLWMMYSVKRLFPEYKPKPLSQFLILIPAIISFLLILSSPSSKLIYSLNEVNRYQRGSMMFLVIGLSYLYWFAGAAIVIREMILKKRIRERSMYLSLLLFPIPTIIGFVLQILFYGISVVWICSAVSLMILFINLQNYQISRDVLTGLFNRRQTNKQLEWEISQPENGDLLFAVMIDMDQFKKINDSFGHITGDEAIVRVSKLIKKSFREKDFVGRFGGDEFIVIGHSKSENELCSILDKMQKNISDCNEKEDLPYRLSVSAGYSLYSERETLSTDRIITEADKEMYRIKTAKAQARA